MSFLWDFGDNTTSEDRDPLHSYDKVGEYRIIMQATSEFGCIDTIGSAVKIIPFTLFVPNAFRPDSEIPENRIFIPIRYGIDPGKYQFQVLNRIGSVVFETQDANVGWNGKMANGTIYDPGVYVWIVKYTDIQGYDHAQKGTVMLVR